MTAANANRPSPSPAPPPPVPPNGAGDGTGDRIQFPDFCSRVDLQNVLYLHEPGHIPTLIAHFGSPDTNFVLGDVPIGWAATQERDGLRIADLLVAFNVDRAAIIAAMGYSISEQGKPPDFVLEVASPTVARWDEIENPGDYADFGVPEYWRFDHEWGRNGTTGLAGDRLVNGVYQPITIYQDGPARHWGYSAILDLDLCWEDGELRFYDPAAQRYLGTYDSMRSARIASEEARDAARADRIAAESRIADLQAEIARRRAGQSLD